MLFAGFCQNFNDRCARRHSTEQWRDVWSAKTHETRMSQEGSSFLLRSDSPKSCEKCKNVSPDVARAPASYCCASAVPQTCPTRRSRRPSAQIPQKQEEPKRLKADHGSKVLGEVTVDQCIGGGRGWVHALETSLPDAAAASASGATRSPSARITPDLQGPGRRRRADARSHPLVVTHGRDSDEGTVRRSDGGEASGLFACSATQLLDSLPRRCTR